MDRIDPVSKKPIRPPLEDEVETSESGLAEDVDRAEGLDPAAEAEALEQDPDEVPNRVQKPEPPHEEVVEPKG